MTKDKTGVQLNQGHTSTDDFITKKYVLPLLKDEKMRNTLKKGSIFFFKKKRKNVKPLRNGSGIVEIRSNFVRMISYGSRMLWNRFWLKFH